MNSDFTDLMLFKVNQTKSTTLTIRVSPAQKVCISALAEQRGISSARFMLDLVGLELMRLCKASEKGA